MVTVSPALQLAKLLVNLAICATSGPLRLLTRRHLISELASAKSVTQILLTLVPQDSGKAHGLFWPIEGSIYQKLKGRPLGREVIQAQVSMYYNVLMYYILEWRRKARRDSSAQTPAAEIL